mgnify:FL=1
MTLYQRLRQKEKIMRGVFFTCAVFSVLALITILVFLLVGGVPFLAKTGVGQFLFGTNWDPLAETPSYGILPMIVATLYVTALSVLIGVPIGLGTALALYRFLPKRLVRPVKQAINLLAGIPSVLFGLFGITVIVPFLRDVLSPNGVGYGILAASLVLSVMILPTVVSISCDSLESVPQEYYSGALALGATKEQATFSVMLPAAKSGILAGVVLAIGRVVGETMAVIMVIGGSAEMPHGLFQSVRTLTANIAMGAMEMRGDPLNALIATGVILLVFTLLLNVSFSALKRKGEREEKQ